nr:retrotransposon protein, putative, unclassified [Tanacetum cinerariifolium]
MTLPNPQRHVMPIEVLTKSKLVPTNAARPVTAAVPKPLVTRPRQTKTVVTKPHSPPRRIINNQSNLSAGVQEQFDVEKAGEESAQQYVLFPVWNFGSTNPQNTDDDVAFGSKKPEFEERKPESEVHVSLSSKLEDITYSDNEEDVGAKVDFTNLETTITISPIPTTRVHRDHLVTQIVGDLSSATQTRSMTRVAKDQGFEDPDYPDKVYKVVKALYGLHQAPRA